MLIGTSWLAGLLTYSREGMAGTAPSSLMGVARDAFSPPSPMGRCPTCAQTLNPVSSSPPHTVSSHSYFQIMFSSTILSSIVDFIVGNTFQTVLTEVTYNDAL